MMNFNPFPNIETENLILRRMNDNDIQDLFEMRKDTRMIEYTDSKIDEDIMETKTYLDKMNNGIDDNKWIIWAIEHKQSKKVIGTISIWNIDSKKNSAELGYGLIPEYQGLGFMKESLSSIVKYGFNVMNLYFLEAYTEINNSRSFRLLERCNFIEINRVDEKGYYSDRTYHMVVFRLEKPKSPVL